MARLTPLEKLRSYVRTYQDGASIIDDGFAQWLVVGTTPQKASIARKAIILGMKVNFSDTLTVDGVHSEMTVNY